MNKWIIFIGGIVVGIILTGFYNLLKISSEIPEDKGEIQKSDDGVTMFEEPGDDVKCASFKVFQVIEEHAALASGIGKYDLYSGPVYLIINKEKKYYYDEQIVKVPKGKVVRQVGIYRYPNKENMIKTVPIVEIMSK